MKNVKTPPLEVNKLSVNRSGQTVLEDVCLTINEGEFVGLVGPNGGGKTTLILTILGLLKFRKGSVQLYGQSSPSNSILRKLGWVSQHASNIPKNIKLTVKELVQLGTLNSSNMFWRYSAEQNEKVDHAINLAGLQSVQDKNISNLSGGQRQRAVSKYLYLCVEPLCLGILFLTGPKDLTSISFVDIVSCPQVFYESKPSTASILPFGVSKFMSNPCLDTHLLKAKPILATLCPSNHTPCID